MIGWQNQEACVRIHRTRDLSGIHPTKIIKIENSVKREIEESGQIKNPSVEFSFLQNFDNKKKLCVDWSNRFVIVLLINFVNMRYNTIF